MMQIESKARKVNGMDRVQRPDPEVEAKPSKPQRQRFSLSYKRAVVAEAEKCTEAGAIGVLLRREGLFSSQLSQWRKQIEVDGLNGPPPKRGRKVKQESKELAQVRQENERLRSRLAQAELIIGAQKKRENTIKCVNGETPGKRLELREPKAKGANHDTQRQSKTSKESTERRAGATGVRSSRDY